MMQASVYHNQHRKARRGSGESLFGGYGALTPAGNGAGRTWGFSLCLTSRKTRPGEIAIFPGHFPIRFASLRGCNAQGGAARGICSPLAGAGCDIDRHIIRSLSRRSLLLGVGERSGVYSLRRSRLATALASRTHCLSAPHCSALRLSQHVSGKSPNAAEGHVLERLSSSFGCYVPKRSDGAIAVVQEVEP